MLRSIFFICIVTVSAFGDSLANPMLYCGHFGSRNRVTERLECAVGPHQYSLKPYAFDLSNYYVEDADGKKVEGAITRDAYTITFIAKKPFIAQQKYRLKIKLTDLNQGKKNKLRVSWNKNKASGTQMFCFEGQETIEDSGYENRPERGVCEAKKP